MKFAHQQQEPLSINLTPLIDVVFLLLIFFMITTTFTRETQLEVSLPEASSAQAASQEQQRIDILISADGLYSVNGQALVNAQPLTLRRAIIELAEDERQMPFVITADAQTPHQAVVTAMDVAGQLGFSQLRITTQDLAGAADVDDPSSP
ncbi:Biopolymer transport protein ExbD/TolR [Nitrincola lacisaponensis]|uniref:Biopolymer transport protein ExbD/TolR n=1 Tax=Nitrincola lacisaponensis TaxID=267850 RepID=A0A063Y617_9GAMM|nr:biopolymer transporter ExbD [Nitrincola lacisaponensis]KDE39937.1 Biopolymer transport protein ExbD/TolR [Nitrincola lacisaponensis]